MPVAWLVRSITVVGTAPEPKPHDQVLDLSEMSKLCTAREKRVSVERRAKCVQRAIRLLATVVNWPDTDMFIRPECDWLWIKRLG